MGGEEWVLRQGRKRRVKQGRSGAGTQIEEGDIDKPGGGGAGEE